MTEFETKAGKYENKAAQCKQWAAQAPEGPQRAFFEVLAGYYDGLATDFRQAIARRSIA